MGIKPGTIDTHDINMPTPPGASMGCPVSLTTWQMSASSELPTIVTIVVDDFGYDFGYTDVSYNF